MAAIHRDPYSKQDLSSAAGICHKSMFYDAVLSWERLSATLVFFLQINQGLFFFFLLSFTFKYCDFCLYVNKCANLNKSVYTVYTVYTTVYTILGMV